MAPEMREERLERIRSDRRDAIIAAALRTFAENGIRLTKVSMIAAAAGVSHGLVYHYFSSKEEVLHESLAWAMSGADELFAHIGGLQASPFDKLKQFVKFALTEGNSDVFRVIQHVQRSVDTPERTKELIERGGLQYVEALMPLIVQGQAAGEIIAGDPQELLEMLLTVMTGLMMDADLAWWSRAIDRKVELLLRFLAAR